jgi:hypothetical protein
VSEHPSASRQGSIVQSQGRTRAARMAIIPGKPMWSFGCRKSGADLSAADSAPMHRRGFNIAVVDLVRVAGYGEPWAVGRSARLFTSGLRSWRWGRGSSRGWKGSCRARWNSSSSPACGQCWGRCSTCRLVERAVRRGVLIRRARRVPVRAHACSTPASAPAARVRLWEIAAQPARRRWRQTGPRAGAPAPSRSGRRSNASRLDEQML